MQQKIGRKIKRKRWSPPPEFFAPSNPEEFKFCFALMNAASSGKMKVPTPNPIPIDGVGEISLTNTPFNRGMLAVSKHLNETHPHDSDGSTPPEFYALMTRLMALGDLLVGAIRNTQVLMEKYLNRENEASMGYVEVAEPLVEAAATATLMKRGGFKVDSLFAIASKLSEKYDDAQSQECGS